MRMNNSKTNRPSEKLSVPISVVTSTNPTRLTKSFALTKDGELEKISGGNLVEGRVETPEVDGLSGLKSLIQGLTTDQALIYGLPKIAPARLMTKKMHEKAGRPQGAITRSNECFSWNKGPGIFMLDHDPYPGGPKYGRDELVQILREVVAGLSDAKMLWFPSASSFITNQDTGEQLSGLKGQRLYFIVADGRDIPRVGEVIIESLWASGYGHYEVSKSGSLLSRTIFDSSVWQPRVLVNKGT